MRVACTAFDRSGRKYVELIDADSIDAAKSVLRQRGLFVTDAAESLDQSPVARGASSSFARREPTAAQPWFRRSTVSRKELAGFMRQLSVLVGSGTPIVEGIHALERQTPPGAWHDVLTDVRERIEQGVSFSEAMAAHPRTFDAVCRSLIAAGESGGQLDEMLRRLATLVRQQAKSRALVIGAMAYPAVLLTVSMGVLVTMIVFVMPRFAELFDSLGASLPPSTRVLMDVGAFVRQWWWAIGIAIAAAVIGIRAYLLTSAGTRHVHTVMLRLPQFGGLFRRLAAARIARVLGVLLQGKVPLLEALRLTRASVSNMLYQDLISRTEADVTRGENISATWSQSSLMPGSLCEAVRSAERSGQVGPVLSALADFMDEDNEIALKSLSSMLEPAILVVLGLVVGGVALSMFLPLFDLASAGTQGGPS
jgi:type IV pilus assembly protein PilC